MWLFIAMVSAIGIASGCVLIGLSESLGTDAYFLGVPVVLFSFALLAFSLRMRSDPRFRLNRETATVIAPHPPTAVFERLKRALDEPCGSFAIADVALNADPPRVAFRAKVHYAQGGWMTVLCSADLREASNDSTAIALRLKTAMSNYFASAALAAGVLIVFWFVRGRTTGMGLWGWAFAMLVCELMILAFTRMWIGRCRGIVQDWFESIVSRRDHSRSHSADS